jgi:hypothetical protein
MKWPIPNFNDGSQAGNVLPTKLLHVHFLLDETYLQYALAIVVSNTCFHGLAKAREQTYFEASLHTLDRKEREEQPSPQIRP